jgi:four helix bundle protein
MQKGQDIAERLLDLGTAALRLAASLPRGAAGRHVAVQLVRSATGAGANYEEARAAERRADFVHKLGIAAKEPRESCYPLALLQRSGWVKVDLSGLLGESAELAAILGASIRTARSGASARRG